MKKRTKRKLSTTLVGMGTVGALVASLAMNIAYAKEEVATFAGGCFWCVEKTYEGLPGITAVTSGYTGGKETNPTYASVSSGKTGHTEAVQVTYDSDVIEYAGLIQALWHMMDPTDTEGQFVDRGQQYRPGIFYHNDTQRRVAEAAIRELEASGRYSRPITIPVEPFEAFYRAERYHQNYYRNNRVKYSVYTYNSGRFQYVEAIWGDTDDVDYTQFKNADYLSDTAESEADGSAEASPQEQAPMNSKQENDTETDPFANYQKPPDSELRGLLSPVQYKVTQKDATEKAFDNPYWDEERPGIYVDIVSGEPLFSSADKFESGTGWPSFTKPIAEEAVRTRADRSWFMTRIEARSIHADSHLGHVFNDGPAPTGKRWCMNSAAMDFIPLDQMEAEGYGDYIKYVVDNEEQTAQR